MNRALALLVCCLLSAIVALPAQAEDLSMAVAVTVKDDGNNLREYGGEGYKDAPILHVVNQGEWLRVWNWEDKWFMVSTPDGIDGAIHAACLQSAPAELAPQPLDPALRQKLERFLKQLNMAVSTENFAAVELLLHPHGVALNGYVLADAATVPAKQASVVMPVWYATDVSLTQGTPWELLMTGTQPDPALKAGWNPECDCFQLAGDWAGPNDWLESLYPEQGLLPMHAQAMRLADDAVYVDGWPDRVTGYPMPDEPRGDIETAPFSLVYKTGPNGWRLEQRDHVGFIMYVEEYEGMLRLRGLITQPW